MDRTWSASAQRRLLAASFVLLAWACTRDAARPAQATAVPAADNLPMRNTICGSTQRADRGDAAGVWLADAPSATAHFLAFGDSGTGER